MSTIQEGYEIIRRGEVLAADLYYPRNGGGRVTTIEVGMCDVRSADSIRISYDFERDGWSIKQASIFEWSIEDKVCDEGWQEVAFIQSWALRGEA
jgi:hypothetical protein